MGVRNAVVRADLVALWAVPASVEETASFFAILFCG
jgi:hypothetical protein